MKQHHSSLKTIIAGLVFLASILILCGSANAVTWYYAQGNSGVVEDLTAAASVAHTGQGLDIDQTNFTENWVHFPFVTPISPELLDVVTLQIWKGAGTTVDAVHLYDGKTKVAILAGPSFGSEVWTTVYVWLPTPKKFVRGLGVSVKIAAAGESWQSRHVEFGAVGARFSPAP
jgi:hypothetical protein